MKKIFAILFCNFLFNVGSVHADESVYYYCGNGTETKISNQKFRDNTNKLLTYTVVALNTSGKNVKIVGFYPVTDIQNFILHKAATSMSENWKKFSVETAHDLWAPIDFMNLSDQHAQQIDGSDEASAKVSMSTVEVGDQNDPIFYDFYLKIKVPYQLNPEKTKILLPENIVIAQSIRHSGYEPVDQEDDLICKNRF